MKLNIGASVPSNMYKRGWINLDLVRHDRINILGSGLALPFKDNSIDLIHCVHVLEHVTRDKNLLMLKEMQRVLRPGGEAWIEVPDFARIIDKLKTALDNHSKEHIHIWTTSIYGKNERPGMAHYHGFTEELLSDKILDAGFLTVQRKFDMISEHYRLEPVMLMKGIK